MEEQKEKQPKTKEELMKYWIKPHNKKARDVEEKDVERVKKDAEKMLILCYAGNGKYPSGFAVAHTQIEKKDPLNFYVTVKGEIVVNPKIIKHSNYMIDSEEGCLSFPDDEPKIVQRWQKCVVECQTVTEKGKLTEKGTANVSGKEAKITQHEVDHLEGINIYDTR
jgi:peptide deformylase